MAAPPDPGSAEALRRRVADLAAVAPGPRRPLHTDGQWWYLQDPRMPSRAHGWKLHLSARQGQLPQLLDVVVPILLRHTCDAKFAAGAAVLRELNSGLRGPAAVGKAVTVYPQEAEVVRLGLELAEALAGWAGPQVVSDRRIRSDAPVFYRYGLFRMADGDGGGDADYGMAGPDGSVFPGLAEARYRQPPWARDPFTPVSTAVRPSTTRVGVGRYRITAGITRSPNGHVYRAVEVVTGREVVVKQARAYVAEDGAGTDARGRLRHERRVLAALAGVPGVPPWSTTSGTAPTSTWSAARAGRATCGGTSSPQARTTPVRVRAGATGGRWRAGCCGSWTRCTRAASWCATSSPRTWCSTPAAAARWWTSA